MNQTRALTEGAILISLYTVLFLITLFVPVLSLFSIFLLSLPFTFYTVRHGVKKSLLFILITIILSISLGSLATFNLPIMFGSVGIVMGYLYRKKVSSFGLLLGSLLTYLANFVLIFIIGILFLEINLLDSLTQFIDKTIAITESLSGTMNEDVEEKIEQMKEFQKIIPYMLPALFVMLAAFFSFASIFVTNFMMKRFKVEVPKWESFRNWSFPKSIIWYYLIAVILFMTEPEVGSTLYSITINLYLVLMSLLVIQGLAFIYFYFWKKQKGKAIPVIITISLFILPVGLHLVHILGIIDLGFDLRRRIKA